MDFFLVVNVLIIKFHKIKDFCLYDKILNEILILAKVITYVQMTSLENKRQTYLSIK